MKINKIEKSKNLKTIGIIALVLVLIGLVQAATTTLPNGAQLEVSIDNPVTSTEFLIPTGDSTRAVDVSGTASVGLGDPDATFVYVIDVSDSTLGGGGTGCSPVLDCEKKFVKALNDAIIADGSADEAGVVVFGSGSVAAVTADMSPASGDQLIIAPDADSYVNTGVDSVFSSVGSGGVNQYTIKSTTGSATNFAAGLEKALVVVSASTNSKKIVVFVSDGVSNQGGSGFNAAVSALADNGAVVHSIAAGTGSSCTGGTDGTLQQMAVGTGGTCTYVEDPGLLPNIIPDLISSSLDSLEMEVDGGGKNPIPNSAIDPDLPQDGAVSVTYTTTAPNLGPGDHEIDVTANGHDAEGSDSATESVTVHLLQITLEPSEETNELGTPGQTHTVTATVLGPSSGSASVEGRLVEFEILSGPNTGASGTCSPHADCTTDVSGQVSFTYTAVQGLAGLGTDTIRASFTLNNPTGETGSAEVTKVWEDTTPPVPDCLESVNPAGNVPQAPGTGQNEDGFYKLTATDAVDPNPQIFVVDTGSGTVFGPFVSDTNIKYTEDPDAAAPVQKSIGGPNSAVAVHIIGTGDAAVFAIDASGNTAQAVSCLVPPPPK